MAAFSISGCPTTGEGDGSPLRRPQGLPVMPDPMDIQIGQSLRSVRRALGLSRREAARRAGMTHQALGYWEAGERSLKARDAYILSMAYGVGVSAILPDDLGHD